MNEREFASRPQKLFRKLPGNPGKEVYDDGSVEFIRAKRRLRAYLRLNKSREKVRIKSKNKLVFRFLRESKDNKK